METVTRWKLAKQWMLFFELVLLRIFSTPSINSRYRCTGRRYKPLCQDHLQLPFLVELRYLALILVSVGTAVTFQIELPFMFLQGKSHFQNCKGGNPFHWWLLVEVQIQNINQLNLILHFVRGDIWKNLGFLNNPQTIHSIKRGKSQRESSKNEIQFPIS